MIIELMRGFSILIGYFAICVIILLLIRRYTRVNDELFRKTLYLVLLLSLLVFVFGFDRWWVSAIASILFTLVLYPVLSLAESWEGYAKLLTQRKNGEIKNSLILVFSMFTIVITICRGYFNDQWLTLASVYAWGFGDAAAALVGKKFGKHYIKGKYVEGTKSLEGTVAMFIVSFISVLIILLIRGFLPWPGYVVISLITALISAIVELYTLNGSDTITCPLSAMFTLIPLLIIWGGLSI